MAFDVMLRGAPQKDGEACPVFFSVSWWDYDALMKDSRFRVTDPELYQAVACLRPEEIRELQDRYRSQAWTELLRRESDRLDDCVADRPDNFRWWVVSVFEWESGLD